jgi:hypothetical protein
VLCHPLKLRARGASNPWLDIVKLLVEHGADPEIHVVSSYIEEQDGTRVRVILFEGSASGVLRHYVEKEMWKTAEQRAELLEYALRLEKLSTRAQKAGVQTVGATENAKGLGVQGERTKEKATRDTNGKRSAKLSFRRIFKR